MGGEFAVLVREADPEDAPWLCFEDGEFNSKNPEPDFIRIMFEIAQRLGNGARVVGDDDEVYGADGEPIAGTRGALTNPHRPFRLPFWGLLLICLASSTLLLIFLILIGVLVPP